MSTTTDRPFTAATDTFAYAQVFTRATLPSGDAGTPRRERRHMSLLHRSARPARHSATR